jgi:hypothetical protein
MSRYRRPDGSVTISIFSRLCGGAATSAPRVRLTQRAALATRARTHRDAGGVAQHLRLALRDGGRRRQGHGGQAERQPSERLRVRERESAHHKNERERAARAWRRHGLASCASGAACGCGCACARQAGSGLRAAASECASARTRDPRSAACAHHAQACGRARSSRRARATETPSCSLRDVWGCEVRPCTRAPLLLRRRQRRRRACVHVFRQTRRTLAASEHKCRFAQTRAPPMRGRSGAM